MQPIQFQYFGRVVKGKLQYLDRDKMTENLTELEGKNISVTIREIPEGTSAQQRGYYFGVIVRHAQMGYKSIGYHYSEEQARHELESQSPYMREAYDSKHGRRDRLKGISELTKMEFSDHISWASQFIAENFPDVILPEPNYGK